MLKRFSMRKPAFAAVLCLVAFTCLPMFGAPDANGPENTRRGYYRDPAVHSGLIVFNSEGDLWTVSVNGGVAQRLTTAPGSESRAMISPDGKTVAFLADYEGPSAV